MALYSKQLTKFIVEEYTKDSTAETKEILGRASDRTTEVGSSTAVLCLLDAESGDL